MFYTAFWFIMLSRYFYNYIYGARLMAMKDLKRSSSHSSGG